MMRSMPSSKASATAWTAAGAAERHQRELARIVTAVDRDQADAVSHVRVGDAVDALRGVLDAHAQRPGHALLDGATRQRRIETHRAADEVVGVEQPSTIEASVTVASVPPRP